MGYNVLNGLPVIIREKEKQTFTFADSDMARGALKLLERAWLAIYQLPYRLNRILGKWIWTGPKSAAIRLIDDAMGAAVALTIAEGGSLGFKNLSDYWSLAGGANMVLKTVISDEAAAFANGAYSTTFEKVLRTLNPTFVASVN